MAPPAGYESPNQVLPRVARAEPSARGAVRVVGPDDFAPHAGRAGATAVSAAAAAPADGQALASARERIAFLEGSLATSAKLEAAAQAYADRVEERTDAVRRAWESQRADLERQRADLEAARERDRRELVEARAALDHKERELRTLALEMGRVEGRLAAAEQKLLEAPAQEVAPGDDDASPLPSWWTRERAALVAAGLLLALGFTVFGPRGEVAAGGPAERTPVQQLARLAPEARDAVLERLFAPGADAAAASEKVEFGERLSGVELEVLRAHAREHWGLEPAD